MVGLGPRLGFQFVPMTDLGQLAATIELPAGVSLEQTDRYVQRVEAEMQKIPEVETATTLVGPNCPGVISPGLANVGIIPGEVCAPGRVGFVSRSGTLVYQIVYELTSRGIGQSTCIGMGGDPVHGIGFIESLALFEGDPDTELMIMTGEIGGDDEERAASYIAERVAKPVVAYIAGFEAPVGKRMGHAGAIVTGSSGTAAAKAEALEAVGVQVARTPSQVARLVADRLAG